MVATGSGCSVLPVVDMSVVVMVSSLIENPLKVTLALIAASRNCVTIFLRSIEGLIQFSLTILAMTIFGFVLISWISLSISIISA